MYLSYAIVERENVQNLLSPLTLSNKDKYIFPNDIYGETILYFSSIYGTSKTNLLHIILDPMINNESLFNKYISSSNDSNNYKEIKNEECIIYTLDSEISIAEVFIKSRAISIFIGSDNNKEVYRILQKFCKKFILPTLESSKNTQIKQKNFSSLQRSPL